MVNTNYKIVFLVLSLFIISSLFININLAGNYTASQQGSTLIEELKEVDEAIR